jgi:hypothetical protein
MSQGNVEIFKRSDDALRQGEVDAWLEEFFDPEIEWHSALPSIGQLCTRGRTSGAETEVPFALVGEYRNGTTIRVRTYLDPKEALKAMGLAE